MIVDAFLRGVVAGLGIAMPVGAIALLIIEAGRRWRFRAAVSAGLGAALADLTYASVAGVVGTGVAYALGRHTTIIHFVTARRMTGSRVALGTGRGLADSASREEIALSTARSFEAGGSV